MSSCMMKWDIIYSFAVPIRSRAECRWRHSNGRTIRDPLETMSICNRKVRARLVGLKNEESQ